MFVELHPLLAAALHLAEAFRRGLPFTLIVLAVILVLHLIYAFSRRGDAVSRPSWSWWEKLVYLATVASVALLGVTAFFAVIRYGVLDGWLLFFHMFGAGAFVAVLPLLAITWCRASSFGCGEANGDGDQSIQFSWLPKAAFWLLLASGFLVSGTMLLSMLPLFGTDGLHTLLDIHRYSGLVAVVALILHFYGVILQRLALR
jgi:hypothetical protein